MARREKNFSVADYYDEDDEYYDENQQVCEDDEEVAIRESKKEFKKQQKQKKKEQGVQDADIDEIIMEIGDGHFTRE